MRKLYYDTIGNQLYNELGNLFGNAPLSTNLGNSEEIQIQFTKGADQNTPDKWEKSSFDPAISAVFCVDNNYLLNYKSEYLRSLNKDPSILSINKGSISITSIPYSGELYIGDSLTYATYSYNKITYDSLYIYFHMDDQIPLDTVDKSIIKIKETPIAITTTVSTENATTGLLQGVLSFNSKKLESFFEFTNTQSINSTIQVIIRLETNTIGVYQFPIVIKSTFNTNNITIPESDKDIFITKEYLDSFIMPGSDWSIV